MKKSEETKQLFLEQLKKTPIVQIACEKLGVSRASFYRWRSEDAVFAKQADEATLEGHLLVNDLAESQLIGAVKDRNLQAIMYWLKHHHKDYRNRLEIEGTLNTITELSDEQKELVKKALELTGVKFQPYDQQESKSE
ncbi:MAG: hypothetical protein ABII13_00785 [Patescibacteria group bacterium]